MNIASSVSLFFILFAVFFIAVAGFILFVFVRIVSRYLAEKRYNDSQPVLTKDVTVTGKRNAVSGGSGDSAVSTSYYATFEFADTKERAEFTVPSKEYGLMAEDDTGKLTFQGRRYLSFTRNI
ncbi:MAG TPA: DUF2500 domain-containing protein [Pyrinomonadaceae bacterium]|nr:DUF2500 domain-containing protein [Pyrinomonadaceae bacterium]